MSLTGSNITVDGVTMQNSSSFNSVDIITTSASANVNTVVNCKFLNMGDDPNHIVHDMSTIYVSATAGGGIVVANNQIVAASFNAPAAGTGAGIETHGGLQTVSGNVVWGYGGGLNITGVDLGSDESISVTGNSFVTPFIGIGLWSTTFGSHTVGYGLRNVAISGNTITIHQVGYSGLSPKGIYLAGSSTLPIDNLSIANNTISFDLETSLRSGDISEVGIGYGGVSVASSNVSIVHNHIENPPVSGIQWSGALTNLEIAHNIVVNAGTSLDTRVGAGYKVPIWLLATSGSSKMSVVGNDIVDNLATSVMRRAFFLACTTGTPGVRFLDNSVHLAGANLSSWFSYFYQSGNNCNPFIRMNADDEPWVAYASMQGGSTVLDRKVGKLWLLPTDGTGWVTAVSGSTCTAWASGICIHN